MNLDFRVLRALSIRTKLFFLLVIIFLPAFGIIISTQDSNRNGANASIGELKAQFAALFVSFAGVQAGIRASITSWLLGIFGLGHCF